MAAAALGKRKARRNGADEEEGALLEFAPPLALLLKGARERFNSQEDLEHAHKH